MEQLEIIPIDYSTLGSLLSGYKSLHDKVVRLEKSGKIIRLKRGLYIVSPEIHKKGISKELIANHLYGPSYISFENALSFHGLIPERVYTMRSMTTKRGKKFSTPFGIFEYVFSNEDYFNIGIHLEVTRENYAFLIATPEKAICDLIAITPLLKIQSVKAMKEYLGEDLRFDLSALRNFNAEIIRQCIEKGKKKNELNQLYKLLMT